MTVSINAPAQNLREELALAQGHRNQPTFIPVLFWFVGDGSETEFVVTEGWEPFLVFDGGVPQKEGSGDDYTVKIDINVRTVSFNVAPTNLNDILVIGVRS